MSDSDSHLIWFSDYPAIADKIRSFLVSGVGSPQPANP